MRCFLTLESVESASVELALLYGSLAVLGEIFAGCDIIVDAIVYLLHASAQKSIGDCPIGQQKDRCVIRGLLARNSAHSKCGQDGTAGISLKLCVTA